MMERRMKDSGIPWIGMIPEEWKILRHKDIFSKLKKIKDNYEGEDIISLTMSGVIIRDIDNPQGKMPTTFDGYQIVYPNNLLMCLFDIDVTPRCIGLIKNYGLTSPAYSQYKVLDKCFPSYYNYLLQYIDDGKHFLPLSKNLRSSLTDSDFGLISTICPPKKEQEAIASWLDEKCGEIDELIEVEQKMIEELEAYRQATITETVTRGLNPDVPMRQTNISWIPEIPAHWEICRLKDVGHLYGGLTGKAGDDFNVDEEKDEFSLFVPFTNIFNNDIIDPQQLYKVKTSKSEKQNEVKFGDVLFLMSSEDYDGIGKSSLFEIQSESPVYLNSFCKGLRVNCNNSCPKFLNYLIGCKV